MRGLLRSQAGMFPPRLFVTLGHPPMTVGRVAGPRRSSLVQGSQETAGSSEDTELVHGL